MTLDRLVLENFGAFLGKHSVKLTPPSRKRPITLFGGLNGTGKTTLLDALQLALYGKRARCSNRGNTGYDEFLRHCINRHADPTGGSRVELSFHHIVEGREQEYRITRSWHVNGSGVRETVDVYVDGVHDKTVSEAWAEYAEEFVPSRLSHLFFFDGENIEALADLNNAADVLRVGIHSLLGLDLVDRLHDDLDALAARKEKLLQVDDSTGAGLAAADAEVRELSSRRTELLQNLAGFQSLLEQCNYRLEQVKEKLRSEGGELFQQKDILEGNHQTLLGELGVVDAALGELAAGAAPFLLVAELLDGVREQAHREKLSCEASLLEVLLRERDAMLLGKISGLGTSPTVKETIAAFLSLDRRERTLSKDLPKYLQLSNSGAALLNDLQMVTLGGVRKQAVDLLVRRTDIEHALVTVERKLSTVPEEDAIAPFEREREELESRRAGLEQSASQMKDERQRIDHELGRKEGALKRLQDEATQNRLAKEDLARINDHARRAQSTLRVFRERVVERHLARIQASVEQSFRHLLRKQTLVTSLRIDPRSYALELRDSTGMVLRPDRLSAGERQLLAVSLVWGLAKASRRLLPAVIDTPLGSTRLFSPPSSRGALLSCSESPGFTTVHG